MQAGSDIVAADISRRAVRVRGCRIDGLVLRAVLLVATQLAAVMHAHRRIGLPLELVGREVSTAGRAPGGEEIGDREAEAAVTVRRCPESGEGGIEVAQIGRAEHDLGEETGQRACLEAEPAALAIDRGSGDPPAAAVQVGDDVAGRRIGLQPGMHELRRWRLREALEGGQREPGFRAREEQPPDHRARLWQTISACTLDRWQPRKVARPPSSCRCLRPWAQPRCHV